MSGFAAAIGLSKTWPIAADGEDEMDIPGLLVWSSAYVKAAEQLHFSTSNDRSTPFFYGPVIQIVGLATELTLKAMIRGCGYTAQQVRKYSHNTYGAYVDARHCFNEVKFLNLHFSNTLHLSVPEEVRNRLISQDDPDFERRWRNYFDHLRLMDGVYDRPYRSRYVAPGHYAFPETEIVLIGTRILQSAMEERLERR